MQKLHFKFNILTNHSAQINCNIEKISLLCTTVIQLFIAVSNQHVSKKISFMTHCHWKTARSIQFVEAQRKLFTNSTLTVQSYNPEKAFHVYVGRSRLAQVEFEKVYLRQNYNLKKKKKKSLNLNEISNFRFQSHALGWRKQSEVNVRIR